MGRAFTILVGMMAEVEAGILRSGIKSGMAGYKASGGRLGRTSLNIDRDALVRDRLAEKSLTGVAKKCGISRACVVGFTREAQQRETDLTQTDGDAMLCRTSAKIRNRMQKPRALPVRE